MFLRSRRKTVEDSQNPPTSDRRNRKDKFQRSTKKERAIYLLLPLQGRRGSIVGAGGAARLLLFWRKYLFEKTINSANDTGYPPNKKRYGGEPEQDKSDNRTACNSQDHRKHNHITKEFEQKHIVVSYCLY